MPEPHVAWTPETGFAEAERRIAACLASGETTLDLGGLALEELPESLLRCGHLRRLFLGGDADARARRDYRLNSDAFVCNALRALPGAFGDALAQLEELDLAHNRIDDAGAQALAGLTALTSLNLEGSGIGAAGAAHLAHLTALTSLDLGNNRIGDAGAAHLAGLTALTSLDLRNNEIGAAGAAHLAGLTALISLDLGNNEIGDSGAAHLAGLTALTSLDLWGNGIGAAGAAHLAGLTALTSLVLAWNGIGDAGSQALTGLIALTSLDLRSNRIGAEGAQALGGLTALTSLRLSFNGIESAAALAALPALRKITLSDNPMTDAAEALWHLPSLESAILEYCPLGDVPREILSEVWNDNCLPRLRAYFRARRLGAAPLREVKAMLLGNGRVGKTQIANRLAGRGFVDGADSTHGVQIETVPLQPEAGEAITLRLWDFGGQEIYLGTHALFLKTRAIFPIVWAPSSEAAPEHEAYGETSRNFPLDYWLRYVRQMAGRESPVLLVQTRIDEAPAVAPPLADPSLLDAFAPRVETLSYSAKGEGGAPLRHATLVDALAAAAQAVLKRAGAPTIPASWLEVRAVIEEQRCAAEARPLADLADRSLERAAFDALCRRVDPGVEAAGIEALLTWLHQTGAVFHDAERFDGRVIVDQRWALDAIYALFDRRSGINRRIRAQRGRFTLSDLADGPWAGHEPAARELFVGMMQSCDLCFELKRGDADLAIETTYCAPDLLSGRATVAAELDERWTDDAPTETAELAFDLLPPGLLRGVMSGIGEDAGLRAVYWDDGVLFYERETRAKAIVDQVYDDPSPERRSWSGALRIRTQGGDALELLDRLLRCVEQERRALGVEPRERLLAPKLALRRGDAPADAEPERPDRAITPGYEPSARRQFYCSYAWGDDATPEGRLRGEVIEHLKARAEAKGAELLLDRDEMRIGDQISAFMDRLASGERIFVVLSAKYLRSPFCMYELFEIWNNCCRKMSAFRDRTIVIVLPDADIGGYEARGRHADHWRETHERMRARITTHPESLSTKDFEAWKRMGEYALRVADVLEAIADTLIVVDIAQLQRLELPD